MTAAELVAKQNHQLRVDRLVQAERRANHRDFDVRYGNSKRLPGHVDRVRRPRRTHRPSTRLANFQHDLAVVGLLLVTFIVLALA